MRVKLNFYDKRNSPGWVACRAMMFIERAALARAKADL